MDYTVEHDPEGKIIAISVRAGDKATGQMVSYTITETYSQIESYNGVAILPMVGTQRIVIRPQPNPNTVAQAPNPTPQRNR